MEQGEIERVLKAALKGNVYKLPVNSEVHVWPFGTSWYIWFVSPSYRTWNGWRRAEETMAFVDDVLGRAYTEEHVFSCTAKTPAEWDALIHQPAEA